MAAIPDGSSEPCLAGVVPLSGLSMLEGKTLNADVNVPEFHERAQ